MHGGIILMLETLRKSALNNRISFTAWMALIAMSSVLLKLGLLLTDVVPFNADEAIVGLLAKHFLKGEWQIFFYGQAYMGTLDASLVAAMFGVFGPHIILIRVVQILLFIGTVVTTGYLGKQIFQSDKVGLIASLLVAIPNINTTLYTTVSLGGYGEILLIGNLLLIATLKIHEEPRRAWYILWGFLTGIGIWAFGLILIYVVPTSIFILFHAITGERKRQRFIDLSFTGVFLVLGLSPWFLWALFNGFSPLIKELFGSAIAGASPANMGIAILSHAYNFLLFGTTVILGLRPPWEIRWLAKPLLPIALGFWLIVSVYIVQSLKKKDDAYLGRWLLFFVLATLLIGFIFTPFGADPSGRYFLPFTVPMSLFAAEFVWNTSRQSQGGKRIYIALFLVVSYHLWGTMEAANNFPPGLTTQFDSVTWIDHRYDDQLIDFLEEQGELRGYSNYWVAYPLAFRSEEKAIFVPRLPYHEDFRYTSRDNRYQPYNQEVEKSSQVAYITTNHPALDGVLQDGFHDRGISWEEAWIGDYHVFYALSEIVRPEDLKIGELHPDN
jgi:4-amino-4-deoxy-L-arabinose transferase-like glycosyltransferase